MNNGTVRKRYTCKYEIWLDASSPEEAAQIFAEMELKPGASYAIDVIEDEHGKWETVLVQNGEKQ